MTRISCPNTKKSHNGVSETSSYIRVTRSRKSKSSSESCHSYSTMDSHPTQTTIQLEKKKSLYSDADDNQKSIGKSSTEAVIGNYSYLLESCETSEDEEDELFRQDPTSFRTPDWRKNFTNKEDCVDKIREALCSTSKRKVDSPLRKISTPHMSTLQSHLIRKASIAAVKEMATIEQRVSLNKSNEASSNLKSNDIIFMNTPSRKSSLLNLKKGQVPITTSSVEDPCVRKTPYNFLDTCNINTPASAGLNSTTNPFSGISHLFNRSSSEESSPSAPVASKNISPRSILGTGRLTLQRASLGMSTILKGVVAYVEVRTNHDNLSQGVKSHLRTLGAQIEETFTRKVTHVIFKEGMMSTFKKAERWRVPLVSVLWIESCKSAGKIVPAEQFPPTDIDRYKNALPFKRFRKKRSFQPECDIRRLPTRSTHRRLNRLAATVEEPSSAPAKEKRSIIGEHATVNDKQIEDKYLRTLLSVAGPFLEEALNRSDSPPFEGDVYLPLSVRILRKYMTPRCSQTDGKLTRVSEIEKHLNLNQKGRSRLRKFLVFTSDDEAEENLADKSTQTDDDSVDDTISPVQPPLVLRKSAPARLVTLQKKRFKTRSRGKQKNVAPKKNKTSSKNSMLNKKTKESQKVPNNDKENVNSKKNVNFESPQNKGNKLLSGQNPLNPGTSQKTKSSSVKRKILPSSQVIMLEEPVEDLLISKPLPPIYPPHVEATPKRKKGNQNEPAKVYQNTQNRFSEMYNILSSNEDERRSSSWFAPPRRNRPLPKPVIVCTSLHSNETEQVNAIISKLGLFNVEVKVNSYTTHIITGGPRRTLNLVKGIARGCWIVKLDWAFESARAGRWLYEEPYELTEFSPAIKEVRLLRQSFKFLFSLDIFAPCGSIYVCQKTVPPRDDLKEILRLCSAVIVSTAKVAQIVIGSSVVGKLNVQEKWILDCVSQNKLLDTKPYVIRK